METPWLAVVDPRFFIDGSQGEDHIPPSSSLRPYQILEGIQFQLLLGVTTTTYMLVAEPFFCKGGGGVSRNTAAITTTLAMPFLSIDFRPISILWKG